MLLHSLRFKIMVVLIGGALVAAGSCVALIYGIRRADHLIDRAHLSQGQLEMLMLLSGRASDYGLVALEAVRVPQTGRPALAAAVSEVNAVFNLIDASIEKQVAIVEGEEARNAEAREGLGVARMRATFQSLDEQINVLLDAPALPAERQAQARQRLDVFGLSFAPLLSQAVETERTEAQTARRGMAVLKSSLVSIATLFTLAALALAGFLYFGPARSMLGRLRQTVEGAEAVASGDLDTRLTVRGRDELTALMTSFNRMAGNLATRERALVAAKRDLEETVDARTAELRQVNRRLEEIDGNRRRFFTDVSHELRTPLTVILGEAELLLRLRDAIPPACVAAMETIQARAKRLNRRVEDLLRVARSESGRIELKLARAEAGEVLSDAVDDVLGFARHSGIEVKLEAGPGNLYVRGDKDWLRQVCSGLIVNSVKFTAPPGFVRVKAEADGDYAILEISDQGQGIPPAEQELVFDRFYRGKAPLRRETGHGVGLALAKWIMDEHKGMIEVESPGRLASADGGPPGTTMILRLALAEGGAGLRQVEEDAWQTPQRS